MKESAFISRPQSTSLYVMWSAARQLSKVGIAYSPQSRAHQVRHEKNDSSIRLATCWNFVEFGPFEGSPQFERCIHEALRDARLENPDNLFLNEWFAIRWPTAVELVEQCAQLWAPMGLRLRRMPGNHGR